jgi:hypothetical protein
MYLKTTLIFSCGLSLRTTASNTPTVSLTTMPPRQIHRIEPQGPNGSHMVATERIPRGKLILMETPLLQIPVGRHERLNETELWSAGKYSGIKQLTYEYREAASNRRNSFDSLSFCRPKTEVQLTNEKGEGKALTVEEWERLSRAQTNAFERTYEDNMGIKKIVFDVFDETSGSIMLAHQRCVSLE